MAYYKLIIIISFCMKFSRYILINISFLWMFHFSLPRFTRYARFITVSSTHVFVEITRFELVTPCLQGRCSPNWATPPRMRCHLRLFLYISCFFSMGSRWLSPMGLSGLEPPTSRLSGVRSNQLSYKPIFLTLAATYSPVPSPVKYHRPLRS